MTKINENVIMKVLGEAIYEERIGVFMVSKNKKGFTLVELVVVIAIIGIVASILVPSLFTYIRKSKEKEIIGDVKSIVDTSASSITNAYASLDFGKGINNSYNGKPCGIVTSYDLRKVQLKDEHGMNPIDLAIARDVSNMIVPNGKNFDFSGYKGNKYDMSGKELGAYRASNPNCSGFVLIYDDTGIVRIEYTLGDYICIYDGGYHVYKEGESGARFSTFH